MISSVSATHPGKEKEAFRVYDNAPPVVREFYRLNHTNQTRDFALAKRREYGTLDRRQMSIWEAMEYLNTLVDDSDPDTDLSQIEHNLQTAEAIRRDGHPRWFQLVGLIHDLGKVLCLYGEPQWAVVGDTFPVGCAWSDKIVYHEFFRDNPDAQIAGLQTPSAFTRKAVDSRTLTSRGATTNTCTDLQGLLAGRSPVHDPLSFLLSHPSRGRLRLSSERQRSGTARMGEEVQPLPDLNSKGDGKVNVAQLRPYYEELISEFFPDKVRF